MNSKYDSEKTIVYLKQLYEEESGRLEELEKKYNTLSTKYRLLEKDYYLLLEQVRSKD
jgi:hypothetical protein|tara:strand:+ start:2668 stop:2841 length:174 start_codon:yes stop_codon:yes gene_type:complete